MSARTVDAADGRRWSVRSNIEWSTPATGDDFEHDVDGGRGAAVLILSALFLFWLVLIVWTPDLVHIPWYLWVVGVAAVLFFPLRWVLRRPYTIVAATEGIRSGDQEISPPEHWTGLVRGSSRAREEMKWVVRNLRTRGTPGHANSPLHPVN